MEKQLAKSQQTTCQLILSEKEQDSRKLIKYTARLTVETALKGEQLSKLNREDEDNIEEVVIAIVANFNNAINVGNKLNADQVYEIALAIINDYWMLKIDEILNCFKMAKGGKFGEIKRLDQPTIMGFLHQYDTKTKADYFESRTTTMQRREPKEDNEPKAILLSVKEVQSLEKNMPIKEKPEDKEISPERKVQAEKMENYNNTLKGIDEKRAERKTNNDK